MGRIFITGDKHGDFIDIPFFCNRYNTTKEDILIILGDSGINYWLSNLKEKDRTDIIVYKDEHKSKKIKKGLQELPITLFCIHGNHEARAETILGYTKTIFCGAPAYKQEEYDNIYFAIDGEIYTFNKKEYIVIGGAYSIDKEYRLGKQKSGFLGYKWFADEQPSSEIKTRVEEKLKEKSGTVHGVLTHTCPKKYMPTDMFLTQFTFKEDNSTEEWLEKIEENTDYKIWYCGHFHTDRIVDKIHMLFENIDELK